MASKRPKKRDYYQVLGISRDAGDDEIKRAFRELARKYHPDISTADDSEERFKELNQAYAVLSNEQTRARYDRFGFAGVGEQEPGFGSIVDAVDDLIGDLLRRRRSKRRGRDLRYTLELSLPEAALGCEKVIHVPIGESTSEFTVKVPPGATDGSVRRLKGKGAAGEGGGARGDLNVILRVRPHPLFTTERADVWCDVPISFPQAALGDTIDVPTLTGTVRMRVPEGTQSGTVLRLKGRGIPDGAGGGGDQLVRIVVETPTSLTPRQRELLETFAAEHGVDIAHPQATGFLHTLRSFFAE